jgi:hypothetical protein
MGMIQYTLVSHHSNRNSAAKRSASWRTGWAYEAEDEVPAGLLLELKAAMKGDRMISG